jgi:hypothetical protein
MFNVEHLSQIIKDKTKIIFQLWTYLYIYNCKVKIELMNYCFFKRDFVLSHFIYSKRALRRIKPNQAQRSNQKSTNI